MAIAYFGSGADGAGCYVNNGTSMSLTTPASVPVGSFMVAVLGGYTASSNTVSSMTGWTQQYTSYNTNAQIFVMTRLATGGEGAQSVTLGSSAYFCGGISVFTGVDPVNPIVAGAATSYSTSGTATATPSVNNTAATGACRLGLFAGENGTGLSWAPQSGDTQAFTHNGSGSGDASASIEYLLNASSGSQVVTATFSVGTGRRAAAEVFLAPLLSNNAKIMNINQAVMKAATW